MSFKHRLRAWLWKWHQNIGVFSALIVAIITLTGILLNHTSDLKLAKSYVDQPWLLSYYGLEKQVHEMVSLNSGSVSHHSERLHLNGHFLTTCLGGWVGAAPIAMGDAIACRHELHILDHQGEVIDTIKPAYGLPIPIVSINQCGENSLLVSTPDKQVVFNLDSLMAEDSQLHCTGSFYATQYAPEEEQSGLSWQKVIQDLHSGRIFGPLGVWFYDIAALALLFLSLSGFWLWFSRRRRQLLP